MMMAASHVQNQAVVPHLIVITEEQNVMLPVPRPPCGGFSAAAAQTPLRSSPVIKQQPFHTWHQFALAHLAMQALVVKLACLASIIALPKQQLHQRALNVQQASSRAALARAPASSAKLGGLVVPLALPQTPAPCVVLARPACLVPLQQVLAQPALLAQQAKQVHACHAARQTSTRTMLARVPAQHVQPAMQQAC
jgi:hypothetical protein